MLRITQATTKEHFQQVWQLRTEMGRWDATQSQRLGLDPEKVLAFFYSTDEEISYRENTPLAGGLLLASYAQEAAGCAAFRRSNANACELYHVFVRERFRGMRIGRLMVAKLVAAVRDVGYQVMLLETMTFMTEARALYASVGSS